MKKRYLLSLFLLCVFCVKAQFGNSKEIAFSVSGVSYASLFSLDKPSLLLSADFYYYFQRRQHFFKIGGDYHFTNRKVWDFRNYSASGRLVYGFRLLDMSISNKLFVEGGFIGGINYVPDSLPTGERINVPKTTQLFYGAVAGLKYLYVINRTFSYFVNMNFFYTNSWYVVTNTFEVGLSINL